MLMWIIFVLAKMIMLQVVYIRKKENFKHSAKFSISNIFFLNCLILKSLYYLLLIYLFLINTIFFYL